ncbi:unnamed protein product [Amoebophrya sp. A120]|nr:unnamed protein product [Amoebophrya sp. A120]|eukprot:GSA120T00007800001.1
MRPPPGGGAIHSNNPNISTKQRGPAPPGGAPPLSSEQEEMRYAQQQQQRASPSNNQMVLLSNPQPASVTSSTSGGGAGTSGSRPGATSSKESSSGGSSSGQEKDPVRFGTDATKREDFDQEFEQYVLSEDARRRKKKWTYAKAFGGAAVAASSGALFGIPLAAMVLMGAAGAGAGMFGMRQMNGKDGKQRGQKSIEDEAGPGGRSPGRRRYATHKRFLQTGRPPPSLKRVRFLIKWASIKIDELEEGDHPGVIQLMDDIISEFSLVVEAAKTSLNAETERQKLHAFVRFLEKIKTYKKYAHANQVWLKSWEESNDEELNEIGDVNSRMVLPSDAWLRLQFVFPTIINIAKILSAHEKVHKTAHLGCTPVGGQIVNAIDHLADWCYSVLSMRRVKRFLAEYEEMAAAALEDNAKQQALLDGKMQVEEDSDSTEKKNAKSDGTLLKAASPATVAKVEKSYKGISTKNDLGGGIADDDPSTGFKPDPRIAGVKTTTQTQGIYNYREQPPPPPGAPNNTPSNPATPSAASSSRSNKATSKSPAKKTKAKSGTSLSPEKQQMQRGSIQARQHNSFHSLPDDADGDQDDNDAEEDDYFPPEGAEDEFSDGSDCFHDAESDNDIDPEISMHSDTRSEVPSVHQPFRNSWHALSNGQNPSHHSDCFPYVEPDNPEKKKNCWSRSVTAWQVRGKNYLKDKKKIASPPPFAVGLAADICDCPTALAVYARHPEGFVQRCRKGGEGRFLFVLNFRFTPKHMVLVWALDHKEYQDPMFQNFLSLPPEEKSKRFKFIPCLVEGPWLVRQAVGTKPALLGNKIKSDWYQGDDFIEMSVDIFSSSAARAILGVTSGAARKLILEFGLLLEGQSVDELPERMMTGFRIIFPDLDKARLMSPEEGMPLLKGGGAAQG